MLELQQRHRVAVGAAASSDLADDAADSDASSRLIGRVSFMRSRALVAYAGDQLPDFNLGDARMLELAATTGCVPVLAELIDVRGCHADRDKPRVSGAT